MTLPNDTARIILGTWLKGQHREDIKQIPPTMFGAYTELAKAIRTEDNPVKAARISKTDMADVASMMGGELEVLYEIAMGEVLDENRRTWLAEHPNAKPDEIIEAMREYMRPWTQSVPEPASLVDVWADYLGVLDERKEARTISTGISQLDDLTGGIFPQTLTAVGARPATGKSAFCLQVAEYVASQGNKVLFYSLEMSEAQNMDRLLLRCTRNIGQKALREGRLTQEQWEEVNEAQEVIGQLSGKLIFSQERDLPKIEAMIQKGQPDLVVIDQLTQLQDSSMRFPDRRLQFSHMTASLKRICMEQNTAVWLACQLNRAVNGSSKPTMEYLKESGSIEEDADNVILLARNEKEEEARNLRGNRVIDVSLAKHRAGDIGEFGLQFIVQRFGFVPLEEIPQGFYQTDDEEEF